MIISRIIGGLGNQMFQYAMGRVLSWHHDVPLLLDVSGFHGYDLHQGEELSRVFGCRAAKAQASDIRQVLGWQAHPFIRRCLARSELKTWRREAFVVEPSFAYWPGIWDVPADCYLYGYWQSARYFSDQATRIRTEFTFKPPLNKRNQELAERISSCNSVGLHVRRGDYLSNAANLSLYHECGPDYYRSAADHLHQRQDRLVFFVFSDDIPWSKQRLDLGADCHFIDHNQGVDSHCDMQLMSLCRHQVIANSSFSWWAAWLNGHDEKIVIAPKKWFKDGRETSDLYSKEWMKL